MKKPSIFPRTLQEISAHRQFIYGASALWIVIYHMNTDIPSKGWMRIASLIQETGACGVEVFLLLTGFGLYYALNHNPDVGRFYRRRLMRVFLPAILVFLSFDLFACPLMLKLELTPVFFLTWPWSGGMWYVSFILVMYFIYPLIHGWLQPRYMKCWTIAAAICSAVAFSLEHLPIHMPGELLRAFTRIPVFLLGCMMAPAMAQNRRIPRWVIPVSLVAGVAGVMIWRMMKRVHFLYSLRMLAFLFLAAAAILLLVAIARLLQRNGVGKRIYSFFMFCGGISLEVYLVFDRVRESLEYVPSVGGISSAGLDIIALLLTLPLAYLLRRLCGCLIAAFGRRKA